MNKNLKNKTLLSALLLTTAIIPQTIQPNGCIDFIIGGTLIAATCIGVSAAANSFRWSDHDILTWAENGTAKLSRKYQQLRSNRGTLLSDVRIFGLHNSASSCGWGDRATAIKDNSRLFPLHSANLIIQEDIQALGEFKKYIETRNLVQVAIRHNFYYEISDLASYLVFLSNGIDTSFEYQEEERFLQEKVDRIRQQRLDRERNQALQDQAQAQRETTQATKEAARAIREAAQVARETAHTNEPNIVHVTINPVTPEPVYAWNTQQPSRKKAQKKTRAINKTNNTIPLTFPDQMSLEEYEQLMEDEDDFFVFSNEMTLEEYNQLS
jgi:hypothetical protein